MLNNITNSQAASKVELIRFSRLGLTTARAESEISRKQENLNTYRTNDIQYNQAPEMQDVPSKSRRINKDIDTYYFQ